MWPFKEKKPPLKWEDTPPQVPDALAEINALENAEWNMKRAGDRTGKLLMGHHCQELRQQFSRQTGHILTYNTHTCQWEIWEPGKKR